MRDNKHPTFATTLENTKIKKNQLLVFMLVIEAMDKHNRILLDTVDQINIVELDIENNQTKFQEKNFKPHLKYRKERDREGLQNEQKCGELYYLISTLFFIKDQTQLLPLVNIFNSSFEEYQVNHDTSEN